jgi:hypothetical protein
MCKKAMEKASEKIIRETCHKEREEKRVQKFTTYFTANEQAFQRPAIRSARAKFECNWFRIVVREAKQCLYEHL